MSWKMWTALGLVAWGFFNMYQLRGARAELSEYKLSVSQANEQAQAKKIADYRQAQRSNTRIQDAQREMEAWMEADRAATLRSVTSLRSEVARLNGRQRPTDTVAAGYAHEASVARSVAEQCSERYRKVDGDAKSLGNQVIGLQDYIANVCHPALRKQGAALAPQGLQGAAPDESGL